MTLHERLSRVRDGRWLVLGLFLVSLAVAAFMPEPSWWQISGPSWLHVSTAQAAWTAHPAPVGVLAILLLAASGLVAYVITPWDRRHHEIRGWWLTGVVGCLVGAPLDLLLFNQSVYEAAFAPNPSLWLLAVVFDASGFVVIGTVTITILWFLWWGAVHLARAPVLGAPLRVPANWIVRRLEGKAEARRETLRQYEAWRAGQGPRPPPF